MFNAKGLKAIGGFRSKHNLFQDVVAELKLASIMGFKNIPDIKASFRKHPGEMTFASKVINWCEDSLYLLYLIAELIPDERKTILKKGKKFFAHLNYNRAYAVKPLKDRIKAYYIVFKTFGYTEPPPLIKRLIIVNPIYRGIGYIKRRI